MSPRSCQDEGSPSPWPFWFHEPINSSLFKPVWVGFSVTWNSSTGFRQECDTVVCFSNMALAATARHRDLKEQALSPPPKRAYDKGQAELGTVIAYHHNGYDFFFLFGVCSNAPPPTNTHTQLGLKPRALLQLHSQRRIISPTLSSFPVRCRDWS